MVPRNQRSYDRARVTNMYTCESPCPRVPHFPQTLFHSCIYLVDPASMVSSTSRHHLFPPHTLSKTTVSAQNPDETPPLTDDDGDSDVDTDSNPGSLNMLPAELRVFRRLAERVNVLPIIGRADSLTDDKLRAVKATLKRELYEADLGFGVSKTASSSLQNASQASNPPHSAPGIPQPATNASISPINTSQPRSWACHAYDDCRVYARCRRSKILWQRKTFPMSSPCRPHRGSRLAHTSTADVHEHCLRDG